MFDSSRVGNVTRYRAVVLTLMTSKRSPPTSTTLMEHLEHYRIVGLLDQLLGWVLDSQTFEVPMFIS